MTEAEHTDEIAPSVHYEWQWQPWPHTEWCDYKRYPLFTVEQALEHKPTLVVDVPLRLVRRTVITEVVE